MNHIHQKTCCLITNECSILIQVEEAGEQSFFEEVGVGSYALEADLR